MQKFYCIGNLTKKPEYYETQNGSSVSKFCVAVNRQFNRDETDYFNIVTWNGLAESCQKHLDKGSKVAIIGYIQNRSFEDSNGNKKLISEVIAQEVEFLSHSNNNNNESERISRECEKVKGDLPF